MVQIQLINHVVEIERRQEFLEDRRISRRSEPYVNFLAAPQTSQEKGAIHREERAPADFLRALGLHL